MKNSEKGISLIITFFIMIIILAVVLSISVILYSEVKVIKNMGDSVVAFYIADSGIEKTLYYDRKTILPAGAAGSKRGICYVCDPDLPSNDPNKSPDCKSREPDKPNGCDSLTCEDCTITFNSVSLPGSPQKTYSVTAVVSQVPLLDDPVRKYSNLSIYSTGTYSPAVGASSVQRAIQIDISKDESKGIAPQINFAYVNWKNNSLGATVIILTDVNSHGHGLKPGSVMAKIKGRNFGNTTDVDVPLEPVSSDFITTGRDYTDGYFRGLWSTGEVEGAYSALITACDKDNICSAPFEAVGVSQP